MKSNIAYKDIFDNQEEKNYRDFISSMSETTVFENDTWTLDKMRRNNAQKSNDYSIYFKNISALYKQEVKYYIAFKIMNGVNVNSCRAAVSGLYHLSKIAEIYKNSDLSCCCRYAFAEKVKKYLDIRIKSENTKSKIWINIGNFYSSMYQNSDIDKDAFDINPYCYCRRIDEKFIPKEVIEQLDTLFLDNKIQLHQRLIYWILRLIPSRISEVCAIPIDCIKRFNGKYVLFIPSWKQNGGHMSGEIRSIHLEYTGMGKFLIDLVQEQQENSKGLQPYLDMRYQGLLFTYLLAWKSFKGTTANFKVRKGNVFTASPPSIGRFFYKVCTINNIKDRNGKYYSVTSHQFRHNGITERLDFGFTTEQIAFMTAHKGENMILSAYNHINLKPETIICKQNIVNHEPEKKVRALFGGRILNMDDDTEKRLLANLRSHKVRGGICSDVTGCDSDMMSCLSCNYFIPETAQLPYFIEQVKQWKEKAKRFSAFPIIAQNSEANAVLNELIIDKINLLVSEEKFNETNI